MLPFCSNPGWDMLVDLPCTQEPKNHKFFQQFWSIVRFLFWYISLYFSKRTPRHLFFSIFQRARLREVTRIPQESHKDSPVKPLLESVSLSGRVFFEYVIVDALGVFALSLSQHMGQIFSSLPSRGFENHFSWNIKHR